MPTLDDAIDAAARLIALRDRHGIDYLDTAVLDLLVRCRGCVADAIATAAHEIARSAIASRVYVHDADDRPTATLQ